MICGRPLWCTGPSKNSQMSIGSSRDRDSASRYSPEVRRSGLLFPIEEKHEVGSGRDLLFAKRVQHGEYRGNRRFVVTGRSRIEPPFRIDRLAVFGHRPRFAASLHRGRVERRLERRMRPRLRIHRLAVVVDVDPERARRARHGQRAVDDGRRAIHAEQLRLHAGGLQLVADVRGGPLDIRGIARAIGIGQQGREVAQDARAIGLAVARDDVGAGLRGEDGGQRDGDRTGHDQAVTRSHGGDYASLSAR